MRISAHRRCAVCLRLLENWRLPAHRLRTGLLRLPARRLLSVRMAHPHRSGLPGLRPDSELARGESITIPDPFTDRPNRAMSTRQHQAFRSRLKHKPAAGADAVAVDRVVAAAEAGPGGVRTFDPIGEVAAPEPEAHGAATGAEAQAAAAVRGGRAGIVSGLPTICSPSGGSQRTTGDIRQLGCHLRACGNEVLRRHLTCLRATPDPYQ